MVEESDEEEEEMAKQKQVALLKNNPKGKQPKKHTRKVISK